MTRSSSGISSGSRASISSTITNLRTYLSSRFHFRTPIEQEVLSAIGRLKNIPAMGKDGIPISILRI